MTQTRTRGERIADYLNRVTSAGDFPALTEQLRPVLDVLRHENAPMQMLANIVLKDYSLTLKVLRTANSWAYNRSGRRILSVTQAMVLLGVENVRDIAGGLLLLEHFHARSPGLKQLMALSMLTASHARSAAEHISYTRPEEMHLRGMFRNLGEVLVACHGPDDYAAIMAKVRERVPLGQACQETLRFRFEDLGAAVCEAWGLPGSSPAGQAEESRDADKIVAFGHDLTNAVYRQSAGDSPANLALVLSRYAGELALTPEALQGIVREAVSATQEVFESLGVSVKDLRLSRQADQALATLNATPEDAVDRPEEGAEAVAAGVRTGTSDEARARLLKEIEAAVDDPAHFDLNESVLTVLEALLRAGPFDRTVFCLLGEGRTELAGRFGLGDGVDALVPRLRFPIKIGPHGLAVGQAMLRRTDLLASVARNPSPDEARLLALVSASSVLLLPLVAGGAALGAIYADRQGGVPPDAATLNFAHHLSGQASRALARARRERELAAKRPAVITPEAKRDLVLRLLRGEAPELVSREAGVPVVELEAWRRTFLEAALQGLKAPS
jgi:HD-like signal output (HDOD) protein